jgi:hypothetical protein
MEAIAIGELKKEFAAQFRIHGGDAEFFLCFANGGGGGGFAGFDAAAGSIDFAGTKAAFFMDEQDLVAFEDKAKDGTVGGSPAAPVDFHKVGHGRRLPRSGQPFNPGELADG